MAYSSKLGRWVQQDPAGYIDGTNLYQFVASTPVNRTDPQGLGPVPIPPPGPPYNGPGLSDKMIDQLIKDCLRNRPPEIPVKPYDPGPWKPPVQTPKPPVQPPKPPQPFNVKPVDPNPWKPPPLPWYHRPWIRVCPPMFPIIPDFMLPNPNTGGPKPIVV
jgi:hypothetical protein